MKNKFLIMALTTASLFSFMGNAQPPEEPNEITKEKTVPVMAEPMQNNVSYEDAPKVTAKAGFLLEANSGEVLFEHNADDRLPIASMTKIATLGVIYDEISKGNITMDDKVLVSQNAASMGGSQAFLDANSEYTVKDLVQSIVVASANDSCVAMAEKLFGTTEKSVEKMNELAKKVGATNTNFVNPTGLPAVGAYSSARDIAKIYAYIMQSPHYNDFNSVWMYDLTHPSGRVTGLTNTNKLVKFFDGCMGGKTGFTTEAGHCITVTAKKNDINPIAVIIGADNSKTRFAESSNLMNFALNGFENKLIVDKTLPIKTLKVRGAVDNIADLYPAENFYKLTKKGSDSKIVVTSEIPDNAKAPIKACDSMGKIYIMQEGKVIKEIDVKSTKDINSASYIETIKKIIKNAQI